MDAKTNHNEVRALAEMRRLGNKPVTTNACISCDILARAYLDLCARVEKLEAVREAAVRVSRASRAPNWNDTLAPCVGLLDAALSAAEGK